MASGVDLLKIEVEDTDNEHTTMNVQLVVAADNEFEAIGWLTSVLAGEL